MNENSSGRKLHLTRENHEFLKELISRKYIDKSGEGFLMGVSLALKNGLDHKPLKTPRSATGLGSDTVLEDEKSFNQIDDVKALINALYPEKYTETENLKETNRLLSVLADAGLDYLRSKCFNDNKVDTEIYFETINK